MGLQYALYAQGKQMGRRTVRKLVEERTAKKKMWCTDCHSSIKKGEIYTYATLIGFWGSFHINCFNNLSVFFKTENTGEPCPNQSEAKLKIEQGRVLKDIFQTNTGTQE